MQVLIVHNRYQYRGGEDSVVESEISLLRDAGHDVHVEIVSNDAITGAAAKARTFFSTPFDPLRLAWARSLVAEYRPDIVHIHNFFPLLTPAIHQGFAEAGAAVVQTLHNFRLTCANALLLRDGHVCEKCVGGSKLWGVYHRCYRESVAGSAAIVRMQMRAERHRTWSRHVHRFIALTDFGKRKFVAAGLPADRIAVKPNFAALRSAPEETMRSGALFVGRLSSEKGVDDLLEAWRSLPDISLTIVGDGPERAGLERVAPPNVRFLGQQPSTTVASEMERSSFLVLPSICYEGFAMTVVEAFARGLPALVSGLGSMAEIVQPGVNGDLFEPGRPDSIVAAVRRFQESEATQTALSRGARRSYLTAYTPEINLRLLEDIYRQAIATARQQ